MFLNFPGAEVAVADAVKRQPPESTGRGGEALRRRI